MTGHKLILLSGKPKPPFNHSEEMIVYCSAALQYEFLHNEKKVSLQFSAPTNESDLAVEIERQALTQTKRSDCSNGNVKGMDRNQM